METEKIGNSTCITRRFKTHGGSASVVLRLDGCTINEDECAVLHRLAEEMTAKAERALSVEYGSGFFGENRESGEMYYCNLDGKKVYTTPENAIEMCGAIIRLAEEIKSEQENGCRI